MKVSELGRSAFIEIRAHKARSFMTCLSLAIGIAAMLFTFSQTGGTLKRFDDAVRLAGPGRMMIKPREGYVSRGLSPGLTLADARAIRAEFPELFMVYAKNTSHGSRMRLDLFKNDDIRVLGVGPQWRKRDWVYTQRGRFLNERD